MKNKGGVDQADLTRYQESKGDYFLLGNRLPGHLHRPAVGRSSRVPIFLINESGARFAYPAAKSWYEKLAEEMFGTRGRERHQIHLGNLSTRAS